MQAGLPLISKLSIKSWNKKGDFCPILLQTQRIDDSTKTKFRYAEKFKTCTTFKSKSIDYIPKFADSDLTQAK